MTLKPIVASVFLLGLASSSAFAAASSNAGTQAQLDAMKAKIAKMEAVLQHNQSGGFQQNSEWANRITLSGEANIDALISNRAPSTLVNRSANDINLTNANLYLDFIASNWTKGHVSVAYQRISPVFINHASNLVNSNFDLDEAYVNISNFTKSPFYFMAGKQYVNFGDYHPYPMVESLPQLFEQTHATSARVGFVDASGFNASASIFRGATTYSTQSIVNTGTTRVQNFAVNAGFAGSTDNYGYKLGASYMRNMADVDYISLNPGFKAENGYIDRVGALSAYAGVNSGPFDMSANYVTALQNFNRNQLAYIKDGAQSTIRGAKPAAWSIDTGYSFMTMGHQSRAGLGYEGSKEASQLGVVVAGFLAPPKTRYQANYTVNVSKYTDVGVQIYNDRAYDVSRGGTGINSLTGVVRLGVKFA